MSNNYKHVVKKFWPKSVLLLSVLLAVGCSFGQSPLAGVPGLTLWLRADVGIDTVAGGRVISWQDQSPGSNNVTAAGVARPTLISAPTLNNMPTVKFDGHTQFLTGLPISALNNNSSLCGEYLFVVCKGDSAASGLHGGILTIDTSYLYGMWLQRYSNVTYGELFYNNIAANTNYAYVTGGSAMPNSAFPYKIFEVRKIEGQSVTLANNAVPLTAPGQIFEGAQGGPQMCGSFTNGPFNLGYSPGYGGTDGYFGGEIAEVILFDTCLSAAQIAQVESYLGTKYSPTVHIGPRDTVITHGLCALPLTAPTGFVSYHWSTGATTNSISVNTTGTYSVIITDQFGAMQYDTTTVTFPVITLSSSSVVCLGGSTELVPHLSSFAGYTFNWTGGLTTDSISVTAPGLYTLTVTDANNCSFVTNTETVRVDSFKNTLSLGAAASLCSGNKISLVNPDTGWANLHFHWSNGSIDSVTNVTASSGIYSVTVTDAGNCSGSASVSVTIIGVVPTVNFNNDTVCQGTAFIPNNLSTSTGVTYLWNFGDNTTSTLQSPTHLYAAAGTYPVKLTVTNISGGCTNDTTISVLVKPTPLSLFQSGIACTSYPKYKFIDLSTAVNGQAITAWSWNFGNTQTSNLQSPDTIVYSSTANTYQVILQVTQTNGCSAADTNTFTVQPPSAPSNPPTLVSPGNGSVSASDSVGFSWQLVSGAAYYKLEVSPDPTFTSADSTYNNIYINFKAINLPSAPIYYWRVTAFSPCGLGITSTINTLNMLSPAHVPGLTLWLRADVGVDTAAGVVTRWRDQSGSGNDAIGAGGTEPKLISASTINNMPSVKFDGHTQFLTGATIAGLNNNGSLCGEYMFIVCKADSAASGLHGGILTIDTSYLHGMWFQRYSNPSYGELFYNNIAADVNDAYVTGGSAMPNSAFPYKIFEVRKIESQSVTLVTNLVQVGQITEAAVGGTEMCGSFTNGPYNVGLSPGYGGTDGYFGGEIAEILLFDSCLSPAQIAQVESYLGTKYSPTVHIGPRDTIITHGLCALPLTAPTGFASYQWSTGATTNSISVNTSGTYSVIITDQFGVIQHDTTTVSFPVITLNSSALVCQGGSVELVPNIPSYNGLNFHWTGGLTTDSIAVTTGGNYTLTVTDANNCSVVTNTEIVTEDLLNSTVSLGPATTQCAGYRIGLTTPDTGWANLHFNWSNSSTDSVVQITAPSGPYAVTVTDANGCSGSASVSITVMGVVPHVNFSFSPVCAGAPFTPYNLSDSVNVTYFWNFGDGSATASTRFPSHLYANSGTYQVRLTVTRGSCTNDTVIPVMINALPLAAFQSGLACTGNPTYTFQNLSIPAPGQIISSYSWNFGYLSSGDSTMPNPTQVYPAQTDTYSVSLTVTQTNGCHATAVNPFIIESAQAAPSAPLLEFPVNGSVATSDSVTFGWQSAQGAAYYQLLISTDATFSTGDVFYNNIYSNQKVVQLLPDQTYYWKVTAYNACSSVNASVVDTVSTFNPGSLLPANLSLWLRADSGVVATGTAVSKWSDLSPRQNYATASGQAEPAFIPQVPLLNYKPSIKFNATNSVMTSVNATNLGNGSMSIFIVARADGPIAGEPSGIFTIGQLYNGFWIERQGSYGFQVINKYIAGGSPAGILGLPGVMPNASSPYHVYGVMKNFNNNVYVTSNNIFDSILANPYVSSAFTDTAYVLGHMAGTDPYGGNSPYGYMNGEIAEVIIYNTLLNTSQQQQVSNYLFNKYAPPVNLGPDIVQNYSLCPVVLHTGNRFVSYLWSTGQTSDTIIVNQSGKYWVRTVDVFNHTSSDTINIKLAYQGSNPDTGYVCHGDTGQIIQLLNQPTAYSYVWYDSTSPASVVNLNINANILHPATPGYYYTVITDTSHCSIITNKVPVIIDSFYNANLLNPYDTICKFSSITVNSGPYVIDSFLWQPIADTESAPVINASGMYYLASVDNHGCKNYDSTIITTRAQAPYVNFGIPNYCLNNTTYFTDSSAPAQGDAIASYLWNYGGGIPATDTTRNGQTSYEINYGYGNYTVSLKVTTDSGCYAIKTRHITILPSPNAGYADSANNSAYPYVLCAGAGSSLQLTDTSDAIGNSPLVQRFWSFNGVQSSNTGPVIQYTFPSQGFYNIKLEVVNSLGCADSITQQIQVYPPFTAQLSVSDHCLGDLTTFTDLTQSLSIISTLWKFRENGDGPYAYTSNAQIQFNSANTYDVELQVENAIGCISTIDTLVKIVAKPVANFTGLVACQNQNYTPLDSSIAGNGDAINHWSWNIGGTRSSIQSPKVLFRDTGAIGVSLTVSTDEGCVDSVKKVVEVAPVPSALFAFTPLYGTAPLPVTFTNRSTGGTTFYWNFGDGTDTATSVPQTNPAPHTYTQNGNYNVILYARNNAGCYDSLQRTINVMSTNLDLALELVTASTVTQPDGSELVTLYAYLSNLGTRIITSTQLYATLGSTAVSEQNWNGYLPSGQTIKDTFPAQFVVPQGYSNTYICVTAQNTNNGETETDYTNNEVCASLTGTMQLAGPSPNPAMSASQLGIIMPAAGTVYISIMDELGRYVVREFSTNLPVGRSNYDIPVGQLQGGEYYIRVRYNDDTEVRSFVTR